MNDFVRHLHLHRLRTFLHIVFSHVDAGVPVRARSLLLDLRFCDSATLELLAYDLEDNVAAAPAQSRANKDALQESMSLSRRVLALDGGRGLRAALFDARFSAMTYSEMEHIWSDLVSWVLGSTTYAFRCESVVRLKGAAGDAARADNLRNLDPRLPSFRVEASVTEHETILVDEKALAQAHASDRMDWRDKVRASFGSSGRDPIARAKEYLRPPASRARNASASPSIAHWFGY